MVEKTTSPDTKHRTKIRIPTTETKYRRHKPKTRVISGLQSHPITHIPIMSLCTQRTKQFQCDKAITSLLNVFSRCKIPHSNLLLTNHNLHHRLSTLLSIKCMTQTSLTRHIKHTWQHQFSQLLTILTLSKLRLQYCFQRVILEVNHEKVTMEL